ncbi:MAG: hypothetical protein IPK63_14505 [Candidatus Competibacteraceae bacterium]|nr:hypothetical protein [Candidatus Competibacteraceae bacterium]
MNTSIQFTKTQKGSQEIETRKFNLPLEHRSILILIDGKRTVDQLKKQFNKIGNIQQILELLEAEGYIQPNSSSDNPIPITTPSISAISTTQKTAHIDLAKTKHELGVRIKQSFGLMATPLLNQLDKCSTLDAVFSYAIHCRMLIQESSNVKKSDAFWSSVKNIFPD